MAEPVFFRSREELRTWLEEHHATEEELEIGFYRVSAGRTGIGYQDAVDEALCFGWIDGVRHGMDDERYTTRFTPRRKRSIWSQVNLRRFDELRRQGRVHESGLRVFEARDPSRTNLYSFENRAELDEAYLAALRANARAWEFWASQPPGYRRTATWWVISAKREETRRRRLQILIADSEAGRRIAALLPPSGRR